MEEGRALLRGHPTCHVPGMGTHMHTQAHTSHLPCPQSSLRARAEEVPPAQPCWDRPFC